MKHCYFLLPAALLFATAQVSAEEWQPIGNAVVSDGWIVPGYVDDNGDQIDPSTCKFEVPVEESTVTPGVYRLINPFGSKNHPLAEFNISPSDENIVIDARDKTFVIIQPQYSGFVDEDSDEPSGKYAYYVSDMGTYMYNQGQQREIINLFKCASTMVDNTIYIPQPTIGTSPDKVIQAWDPSFPASITLPDNSADDSAQWESQGIATFVDGWILPGFEDNDGKTLVVSEYPIQVEAAINEDNPNLISIVSPYTSSSFVMRASNLSNRKVRIVFDVTDPDFVLVQPQYSGYIARKDNDIRQFFIADGGTAKLALGTTRESIIADGYNATYKDGIITIPKPIFGFDIDGVRYIWGDQETKVYMPGAGVSDITTDDADAPVEYYNLQGVKVENPAAGQLYIRRQGAKVEKVIL